MVSDLFALIAVCRSIGSASDDELRNLDGASVLVVYQALTDIRAELESVIARLEAICAEPNKPEKL
jgi:hypothetical protein